MSVIIRVTDLTKEFSKQIKAVDGLSFTVTSGQVYGFLGQNGAGKSTTIRMLLTLIQPTSGEIEIFGMNLLQSPERNFTEKQEPSLNVLICINTSLRWKTCAFLQ